MRPRRCIGSRRIACASAAATSRRWPRRAPTSAATATAAPDRAGARAGAARARAACSAAIPAAEIAVAKRLAPMPPPLPVGMPSELLERRPDVIAAERRVAAAFNRVGEARAARLPRISLTAGGSSISSDVFVLQDRTNPAWGFGANLFAPLYQGGALRAQVEIRTAEQKQAVADYARTAQRAFGEVENALAAENALARPRGACSRRRCATTSARSSWRRSSTASARSTRGGRTAPAVAVLGAHDAAARAERAARAARQSLSGARRRLRGAAATRYRIRRIVTRCSSALGLRRTCASLPRAFTGPGRSRPARRLRVPPVLGTTIALSGWPR